MTNWKIRRSALTLEGELLDLLGGGRDSRIAARYYGFDGLVGETLQSVGNAFGITRERVRQIVAAASARFRTTPAVPPALDTTIAFVADHIPAATGVLEAEAIEAKMQSKGLSTGLFRLEGVIKAAELLGRRLPFALTHVNGERLVHARDIPRLLSIVHVARRVVARYGIGRVSNVAAKLRKEASGIGSRHLIARVLAHEQSFHWLDPSREWFWSDTGINPVLHRIRKVVSVVNPVHALDLQAGIFRSLRMKGFSPPSEVFLEFCRQAPGLQVSDSTIVAKPCLTPGEVLSQIEKQVVDILCQNGGFVTVSELKSACLRMGLNQTTCYLYLVRSPFISKYRRNRYGLIGSDETLSLATKSESRKSRAELGNMRRIVQPPFSPGVGQIGPRN